MYEPIPIKTHKRAWVLERFFYKIDRIRLPWAVTPSQILAFGLAEVVMSQLPIGWIPLLGDTLIVRYVALPLLLAWGLKRARPDDKPLPMYLLSWALYRLTPKQLVRLKPVGGQGEARIRGVAHWRPADPSASTDQGDMATDVTSYLTQQSSPTMGQDAPVEEPRTMRAPQTVQAPTMPIVDVQVPADPGAHTDDGRAAALRVLFSELEAGR